LAKKGEVMKWEVLFWVGLLALAAFFAALAMNSLRLAPTGELPWRLLAVLIKYAARVEYQVREGDGIKYDISTSLLSYRACPEA
jgi:hypothetical protein